MNRFHSIQLILLQFLMATVQWSCSVGGSTDRPRPHVVLFVVDDLGWSDGSAFGSDLYQTPNLDQLVIDGVMFTNAYSACTVCSPSRASLMTGKYPANINCTDWITGHEKPYAKLKVPEWTMFMDTSEYTLAEALSDEGYQTIHLGKWHLGEDEIYWPENQGFDINIGGHAGGSPKAKGGNGYFSPYNNPRLDDGTDGEYLTERLAGEALDYIIAHANDDQPIFMNLWLYNVHTPLQAKADKIEKYMKLVGDTLRHSNPVYAAMVEHMDDALGTVISALKRANMYDNTVIIFTSDNGGLLGNFRKLKKPITDNSPLRSGKGDMYEGGVRVPMVISWPAAIQGGLTNETMIMSIDVFPTIMGLTNTNPQRQTKFDGIDFSGLLTRKENIQREELFWHYPHYHLEGARPYGAIRKGDWKLVETFEENRLELYNLKEDVGESNNLSSIYPDTANLLHDKLMEWRLQMEAQMPVPNPHYEPSIEEKWSLRK